MACRLIVKDFATQPAATHKDKLLQSHRVRGMLDGIQDRSAKLVRNECVARGTGRQAGATKGHSGSKLAWWLLQAVKSPSARPGLLVQIRIYQDEDGARKEEIAQLRMGASDNVFRCPRPGLRLPVGQDVAFGVAAPLHQRRFRQHTACLHGPLSFIFIPTLSLQQLL